MSSCGCGHYRDRLTGVCADCVEVCRNVGKDCGRRCPCYTEMQRLMWNLEAQKWGMGAAIGILLVILLFFGFVVLRHQHRTRPFGRNEQSVGDSGRGSIVTGIKGNSDCDKYGADEDEEEQTHEKQDAVHENGDCAKPFIIS